MNLYYLFSASRIHHLYRMTLSRQ